MKKILKTALSLISSSFLVTTGAATSVALTSCFNNSNSGEHKNPEVDNPNEHFPQEENQTQSSEPSIKYNPSSSVKNLVSESRFNRIKSIIKEHFNYDRYTLFKLELEGKYLNIEYGSIHDLIDSGEFDIYHPPFVPEGVNVNEIKSYYGGKSVFVEIDLQFYSIRYSKDNTAYIINGKRYFSYGYEYNQILKLNYDALNVMLDFLEYTGINFYKNPVNHIEDILSLSANKQKNIWEIIDSLIQIKPTTPNNINVYTSFLSSVLVSRYRNEVCFEFVYDINKYLDYDINDFEEDVVVPGQIEYSFSCSSYSFSNNDENYFNLDYSCPKSYNNSSQKLWLNIKHIYITEINDFFYDVLENNKLLLPNEIKNQNNF